MSQFFPFTYRIPLLVDPIRLHLFTIQRTTAVGLKYWVGSVRKFVLPPPKVDRPMHRWDKASSPTPAVFGSQLHPLWYHIYFRVFDSRWNSMTDDSPERELDTDDLLQHYPRVVQTNHKGHSNLAGDVSSSTEVRTHKTPRREVRWKLDKSAKNQSLESIGAVSRTTLTAFRHRQQTLPCVILQRHLRNGFPIAVLGIFARR